MGLDPDFEYHDLIREAFLLRRPVNVYGSISLIMRSADVDGANVGGILSKFTDFDVSGDWLNLENLDVALRNDLREVSIPDNLRPGMKSFYYYFEARNHKLYVQTYGDDGSLSVRQIFRYLNSIFSEPDIVGQFGQIYVTPVAWADDILRKSRGIKISNVEIYIEPPNPDDIPDLEELFKKRLKEKNASSVKEIYSAASADGLVIDEDLSQRVLVGARNGYVSIRGKDKITGVRQEFKSSEHPAEASVKYDPDSAIEERAFLSAVDEFSALDRRTIRNGEMP